MERRDESGVCLSSVVTDGSAVKSTEEVQDPVKPKDLQVKWMRGEAAMVREREASRMRSTLPGRSITFFLFFSSSCDNIWKFIREFKRVYLIGTSFEEFLFN